MRGARKKAYETFLEALEDLEQRGCAALDYRLTGPVPINNMCVKHLWGQDRAVVTFREPRKVWILLVGPHDDHDSSVDVYRTLYALADQPIPGGRRTKPSCCGRDDRGPTLDEATIDDLVARATLLARRRRT